MKIGYFLSSGGGVHDHRGRPYRGEHCRIYRFRTHARNGSLVPGPDVELHVEAIKAYEDAGFDELYVNQIGPDQDAFFEAYRDRVLPRVR